MTKTLILGQRFTDDNYALYRAAIEIGWNVERLHSYRIPFDLVMSVQNPVFYVEALFAQDVADQFGYILIEPPEDWLSRLPQKFSKRKIQYLPIAEARMLASPHFIKPPNDKEFPAAVFQNGAEIPSWSQSKMVLVSEPVEWEKEFRCFILDKQLKTFSVYLRGKELQKDNGFISSDEEDDEVNSFVKQILQEVNIPKAVVMDVGVIKDKGWAVVELNAPWGSGIYGCDPKKVLEVVQASVLQKVSHEC
jgi:hypothetical protein